MITFTLILSKPGPGIGLMTPVVHPALPDDVVPGTGELVQIPGTVTEDGIENVLVSKLKVVSVFSKHPSSSLNRTLLQFTITIVTSSKARKGGLRRD